MNTIPISQARKNLGSLVDEAFYAGKPFVLSHGKKPMAAIISINVLAQIFKTIEKYDPGLADTIAILTNPEIQAILKASEQDVRQGRTLPIEAILKD